MKTPIGRFMLAFLDVILAILAPFDFTGTLHGLRHLLRRWERRRIERSS
jgi:hypothetical protein